MPKIDLSAVPAHQGSSYPAPFDAPCASRVRQRLGDAGGLRDFGVNLTRLPPGGWSSQRHWHSHEDELVFMLEGEVSLVEDGGETTLRAGDCAVFPKDTGIGHHMINRSSATAVYLEIGSRQLDDLTTCSDIDMMSANADGHFTHKDGTLYPVAENAAASGRTRSLPTKSRWIAGLDGCRGAWAGVLLDLDAPERHRAARFASVEEVLDTVEAPSVVGIDVPIGLPDRIAGKGRTADLAARRLLGGGRASVFPVPPRAAVYALDYATAKALSRAHSDPPFAPSLQCWNILRYVREVDALLRRRHELRTRVHEVHPEIAFFRLNRDRPLLAGKKGPHRAAGLDERRALLVGAGMPEALVRSRPPAGVGPDDHLDAMAALVVARDIAAGRARALPPTIERDSHGLPIVIWAPADVS